MVLRGATSQRHRSRRGSAPMEHIAPRAAQRAQSQVNELMMSFQSSPT
jgi:hypothetical protein